MARKEGQYFPIFLLKIGVVRPGLACQARPGRARPCRAWPDKRPEYAEGGQIHENHLFIEKRCFRPILIISGPSRPQKWIRLAILRRIHYVRGLETQNKAIS